MLACGKGLTFCVLDSQVLNSLMKNSNSKALFIFPFKVLNCFTSLTLVLQLFVSLTCAHTQVSWKSILYYIFLLYGDILQLKCSCLCAGLGT
jgi:hypothetical protein